MALQRIERDAIVDSAIDASKIADGTIVAAEIADGTITAAKISSAVELGGPSKGTSSVIRTNANTIGENITFDSNTNGMSAGTITINSGYTVTLPTGTTWVIL
jgi:hypothetical protein